MDLQCTLWQPYGALCSPSTNQTVKFMDFVYLSQVVQSICIKAEAEHYRRLLSEPGVFTRGTLYWQLVRMCIGLASMYTMTRILILDSWEHLASVQYSRSQTTAWGEGGLELNLYSSYCCCKLLQSNQIAEHQNCYHLLGTLHALDTTEVKHS